MRSLTLEDAIDVLYGSTVLGTGGGGNLEKGLLKIKNNFSEGKTLSLASLEDVPENEIVASPYYVGSISPEENRVKKNFPIKIKNEILYAFTSLEEYMKRKFYGCIATELGGGNTAAAMDVAMNLQIHLIDADPAGRAVPAVQHSSFFIENVPIAPLSMANKFGDLIIIDSITDDFKAEEIIRNVATQSENSVAVVSQPTTGLILKRVVIPNTITLAERIGKVLRTSSKEGKDPVPEMLLAGKGYFLFEGRVSKDTEWKDEGGYTVGQFEIKGTRKFEGHNYKVWFKNENIISWFDGRPDVSAPDLISVVDRETGFPITNPYLKEGMNVAVIGFKSPDEWRKTKALEIFTPKSFGFNIEYVSIERKHSEFKGVKP
ncbi:MAG: DUF917 domain-containing protein [Candidatus Acidifodinimicrobium sp.]